MKRYLSDIASAVACEMQRRTSGHVHPTRHAPFIVVGRNPSVVVSVFAQPERLALRLSRAAMWPTLQLKAPEFDASSTEKLKSWVAMLPLP